MSLRPLLRCLPFAALFVVAACSERLETGTNCPALCSNNVVAFRDTIFDVVQFDTTFTGFTGEGERWPAPAIATSNGNSFLYETYLPVINRPDSVDVRQIVRFDTLPRTLSNSDTTQITAVTGSKLLLVVDTARSVIAEGTNVLSLYDVDDSTVATDTVPSLLAGRFVPARLISQRTFTRAELVADTIPGTGAVGTIRALSVPIPDAAMLRYIRNGRLRIGMQLSAPGSAALSLVAPSVNAANLVPRLEYDPSPDTAIVPWRVAAKYKPDSLRSIERFRAQSYVARNTTTPLNDGSLEVGGLVGARSLMRVKIPRAFLERVTLVRASLDLTQRPLRTMPGATNGVRVRLRTGIASEVLGSNPRRLVEFLDPTLEGTPLRSLLIAPADSGVRSFDVGDAITLWRTQDSTVATSFIIYGEGETFQSQRPAFFSRRNSNPAVRPRLRVTYTVRREGAIP